MSDHWSHLSTKPTSTTPGYFGEIYSGETYRPKSSPCYGANHQPHPETVGKAMSPTEVKYPNRNRWVGIKEASCGLILATIATAVLLIGSMIVAILMAKDIIHVPSRDAKTLNSTDVDWKRLKATATVLSKAPVVVLPPATAAIVNELPIDDMGSISNTQFGFVTKVRPAPTEVVNIQH
ncbi:hypothetical protein N7456_013582 [Penicillium angulare]|uniref:Uncharacterized protein n=1 Tax=Penicillium angulare TaxID=116970 RepID=A0A9W9EFN0_9EURO|nr:hypothetical protein N7456_013582 [Penicillium angulare]